MLLFMPLVFFLLFFLQKVFFFFLMEWVSHVRRTVLTSFPIRVPREHNFKMTHKAFNINDCPVATQDMYRRSRKTETVPLIRGDVIKEALRRRLNQESKFQKSSVKGKLLNFGALQKEQKDRVAWQRWVRWKTCNSECFKIEIPEKIEN